MVAAWVELSPHARLACMTQPLHRIRHSHAHQARAGDDQGWQAPRTTCAIERRRGTGHHDVAVRHVRHADQHVRLQQAAPHLHREHGAGAHWSGHTHGRVPHAGEAAGSQRRGGSPRSHGCRRPGCCRLCCGSVGLACCGSVASESHGRVASCIAGEVGRVRASILSGRWLKCFVHSQGVHDYHRTHTRTHARVHYSMRQRLTAAVTARQSSPFPISTSLFFRGSLPAPESPTAVLTMGSSTNVSRTP